VPQLHAVGTRWHLFNRPLRNELLPGLRHACRGRWPRSFLQREQWCVCLT
jgi:hypothetical protein